MKVRANIFNRRRNGLLLAAALLTPAIINAESIADRPACEAELREAFERTSGRCLTEVATYKVIVAADDSGRRQEVALAGLGPTTEGQKFARCIADNWSKRRVVPMPEAEVGFELKFTLHLGDCTYR